MKILLILIQAIIRQFFIMPTWSADIHKSTNCRYILALSRPTQKRKYKTMEKSKKKIWLRWGLNSGPPTMFPHILCQNSMKSPAYSSRPHQKLAKNGLKCPQIKKWYKTDPNWNLIFHSLSNFLTVYNVHKLRNCKVVDFWSWRVGEVSGNTVLFNKSPPVAASNLIGKSGNDSQDTLSFLKSITSDWIPFP